MEIPNYFCGEWQCQSNLIGVATLPEQCPRCGADWRITKPPEWPFIVARKDWALLKAIGIGVN